MDRGWVFLIACLVSFNAGSLWVNEAEADGLPVFDKDFSCTTQQKATEYIGDFNIDVTSFGGVELCNFAVDSKKLFNDFQLIELGRFQGTQSNVFIHNVVPPSEYYLWLKNQTGGMRRRNDDPTATAYNSGGYFTMQDGWAKLSTLGRVGVLIHEARHTQGFGHISCDHGPYQNTSMPGCDRSVAQHGAHGVEMEYYARVALQGANYHPVYQSMARLMLLARANFVFNQHPMAQQDGLMALTESGLIRIKDGQNKTLQLAPGEFAGAALKRTSFGATLLQLPNAAWAVDLLDARPQSAINDDYSYFKLLKMNPPPDLRDVEEFDVGNRRFFFVVTALQQVYSYIFANGRWSAPTAIHGVQSLQSVNPSGDQGIFARLSDGTFCALNTKTLACDSAAETWPAAQKTFVKYQNDTVTLGTDGVVRRSDGSPLMELQSIKVLDLVSVPQYNAFE